MLWKLINHKADYPKLAMDEYSFLIKRTGSPTQSVSPCFSLCAQIMYILQCIRRAASTIRKMGGKMMTAKETSESHHQRIVYIAPVKTYGFY